MVALEQRVFLEVALSGNRSCLVMAAQDLGYQEVKF
jgi:hypothetical protein